MTTWFLLFFFFLKPKFVVSLLIILFEGIKIILLAMNCYFSQFIAVTLYCILFFCVNLFVGTRSDKVTPFYPSLCLPLVSNQPRPFIT